MMKKMANILRKAAAGTAAVLLMTVLSGVSGLGTTTALAEPGTTGEDAVTAASDTADTVVSGDNETTAADAAQSDADVATVSSDTAQSDTDDETASSDTAQSDTDDETEYLTDYLKFSREDLVSYLYAHMDTFVGTPYHESPYEFPTPGEDGHMQCEGFVWYVLHEVATENSDNIPCGDASTEPYGNAGGWVNWLFSSGVKFEAYDTIDDMLASGTMRKGDIIWLFDAGGPYAMSDTHHTGFFWGDTADDDKFWHSSALALSDTYAGEEAENRISKIEGMTEESNISEIWVIHLDSSGGTSSTARSGEEVIAARRGIAVNDTDSTAGGQQATDGSTDTIDTEKALSDVSAYAGVFDADWYRSQLDAGMAEQNASYQVTVGGTDYTIPRGDVSADDMTDAELLQYFLLSGVWYGDQASPDFDITWYMQQYPESEAAGNRLAYIRHYLEEGMAAGEQGVGERATDETLSAVSASTDTASDGTGFGDNVLSGSLPSSAPASAQSGVSAKNILRIICVLAFAAAIILRAVIAHEHHRHRES